MAGAARGFQLRDQPRDCRQLREGPIGNGGINARQILHHHAPGTDIEVPDLRIAHLPNRQANILAGGLQESMRAGRPKRIETWGFRLAHGVVGTLLPPAPAIQNDQHHGARQCGGLHEGGLQFL